MKSHGRNAASIIKQRGSIRLQDGRMEPRPPACMPVVCRHADGFDRGRAKAVDPTRNEINYSLGLGLRVMIPGATHLAWYIHRHALHSCFRVEPSICSGSGGQVPIWGRLPTTTGVQIDLHGEVEPGQENGKHQRTSVMSSPRQDVSDRTCRPWKNSVSISVVGAYNEHDS